MSASEIIAGVLLVVGVLAFAFTSLGLLWSKSAYDQIHFLAPGSVVGSVAFVAAVLVHEGLSQSGVKAILIAALLLLSNPVLSHAIARAGRIRRNQQMRPASAQPLAAEDTPLSEEPQ